MTKEKTLAILKPDVVSRKAGGENQFGKIIQHLLDSGLEIIGIKMTSLTKTQAQAFYDIHKERPFFGALVDFMTSGPVVAIVLQGENAVKKNREIMGATDSKKAAPGTIRNLYGTDIERNAIHGSDSLENAQGEIAFFFPGVELAK